MSIREPCLKSCVPVEYSLLLWKVINEGLALYMISINSYQHKDNENKCNSGNTWSFSFFLSLEQIKHLIDFHLVLWFPLPLHFRIKEDSLHGISVFIAVFLKMKSSYFEGKA